MFGHSPKTVMTDVTVKREYAPAVYDESQLETYLRNVLRLEAVACKDWLTNKVDRSVTGKVAHQQCQGELQLPLADCGVVALDYRGRAGIATAIGHAPQVGLASAEAGSVMAVAESLHQHRVGAARRRTQQREPLRQLDVAVPFAGRRRRASLCRCEGIERFLLCPTHQRARRGKDSLSMTQQYPDGKKIIAPAL